MSNQQFQQPRELTVRISPTNFSGLLLNRVPSPVPLTVAYLPYPKPAEAPLDYSSTADLSLTNTICSAVKLIFLKST